MISWAFSSSWAGRPGKLLKKVSKLMKMRKFRILEITLVKIRVDAGIQSQRVRRRHGDVAVTAVNSTRMPSGDWGSPGEVEGRATLLRGKFAWGSQRT